MPAYSPAINLETDPFLEPDQQLMIDRIADVADQMKITEDNVGTYIRTTEHFSDIVRSVGTYVVDAVRFQRRMMRTIPRQIRTEADLESRLQYEAVVTVTRDYLLTTARRFMSFDLGAAAATGDDETLRTGSELAARVVSNQAGSATQALLLADYGIRTPYTSLGETTSTWESAKDAFAANPRVKPPVEISEREGARADELTDRMMDLTELADTMEVPKRSRFNFIELLKATKGGVAAVRHMQGMYGITVARQLLDNPNFPAIPVLNGKDTGDTHRIIGRKVKYLQAAARLDGDLVTDPKARFFVYMFSQLGGRDITNVKQELERDSQKVKRHVVKQLPAQTSDDTE